MPPEHEMREDCKEMRVDFHSFKDRMENSKDGVIRCIYKEIGRRLKITTFLTVLTGLFLIAIFGIGYTWSESDDNNEEHKTLATKVEVATLKEDLKEDIQSVKEELKEDIQASREVILQAIKNIKE